MTIYDKIRDEKLQYNINREAAKISASSFKIDKYEHLAGEKLPLADQSKKTEQAKFSYSPLGKTYEKQIIGKHGKQVLKPNAIIKKYNFYTEKEILNEHTNERCDKISK